MDPPTYIAPSSAAASASAEAAAAASSSDTVATAGHGAAYAANRLSECPPSLLCGAQRMRAGPYVPLTQYGVDESINRALQLKPSHWLATESLASLYKALDGHCGVYLPDAKSVTFQHTQFAVYRPSNYIHLGPPETAPAGATTVAASGAASVVVTGAAASASGVGHSATAAVAGAARAGGGMAGGAAGSASSGEAALEAFRAQQLSQNRRAQNQRGLCHFFMRSGTCLKGSSCPYSHVRQ